MSALPASPRSAGAGASPPYCGPSPGGGGWGFAWIPLVILGLFAALWVTVLLLPPLPYPLGAGPWGPWPFWPVFPFGFFLLVWLVFWAVRWSGWGRGDGGYGGARWPEARSILDGRFARGEIGREEYLERRQLLERP